MRTKDKRGRVLYPEEVTMKRMKKYLAIIRALDRLLTFSKPNQFYCFCPPDDDEATKAWKRAAEAAAGKI